MSFFKEVLTVFVVIALSINLVFAGFVDVSADHKNIDAIEFLESKGIRGDKFYPRRPVAVAEFITMGFLAAGVDRDNLRQNSATRFSDVPANSWFAPFISEADHFGLLTDFRTNLTPARPIYRGEAVKLALGMFGIGVSLTVTEEDFGFRDLRSRHRLAPQIFQALKMGVIDPISDSEFGIMRKMNRAEAAQLFYNLANFSSDNTATIIIQNGVSSWIPGISLLETVWSEVLAKFLFEENIDEEKMLHQAIKGAVEALDDPYTAFLPPAESTSFNDSLSGELEGIGAYLSQDEETNEVKIVSPIKGTPADKAGLRAGDIITEIDDEPVRGLTLTEVVSRIKGVAGTKVKLKILRGSNTLDFHIARAKIEITSVNLEYRNNIAIISVSQFGASTAKEFANVAANISAHNSAGIILDLRNNPGGLLTTAIDMLGYFLPRNSVAAKARYRDTANDAIYYTDRDPTLNGLKTVVLINKGSASASEIVAGALQDHKAATLVGETTFGKGTVQELSFFRDGTALKVTVAHWLSPNEQPIDKHGVTPDLESVDDLDTTVDEILEKALQLF